MNTYAPYQSPLKTVSPRRRRSVSRSAIGIVSTLALCGLAYVYLLGDHGLRKLWTIKQAQAKVAAEVSQLEAKRLDLTGDLDLLKGNPEENARLKFEMERLAREKHGMVRKDELVYRFHKDNTAPLNK